MVKQALYSAIRCEYVRKPTEEVHNRPDLGRASCCVLRLGVDSEELVYRRSSVFTAPLDDDRPIALRLLSLPLNEPRHDRR